MVRDAAATRARILDAAIDEFSTFGLAGARVDRIAKAARANKRAIYEHFTDKRGLFAAAMDRVLDDLATAVPLTEDDLPGYAGRLFDYHRANPQAMRMHLWRQLESPSAGPDATGFYAEKLDGMARSRSSGAPDQEQALNRLLLVTGLAYGWLLAPEDLFRAGASDRGSTERQAAHRDALVEAARRIVASAPG
jgi:AcrR family transcriptional regulator